ncbi:hypothetical protein KIL84_003753 [Mauremys mutica]|uniref:Uncharacterized protein n=1 Tax=Mauremys mutica TaxID=74926 RepID=A0A9D4ATT0_9SAUR|nr:hypothetical protein KIL84_003753 [Mauremys mutica]
MGLTCTISWLLWECLFTPPIFCLGGRGSGFKVWGHIPSAQLNSLSCLHMAQILNKQSELGSAFIDLSAGEGRDYLSKGGPEPGSDSLGVSAPHTTILPPQWFTACFPT